MNKPQKEPDGWWTREYTLNNELVWSAFTQFRPLEISWARDLPNKKHYIIIAPFYVDETQAEKITGVKSYKESTKRLAEAYGGL